MVIRFQIKFPTHFGQQLELIWLDDQHVCIDVLKLSYQQDSWWTAEQSIKPGLHQKYQYRVTQSSGEVEVVDPVQCRILPFRKNLRFNNIVIQDSWPNHLPLQKIPESKAVKLLNADPLNNNFPFITRLKKIHFRVWAPLIPQGFSLALLGSIDLLSNWDEYRPIQMEQKHGWWVVTLPLDSSWVNAEFKSVLYDVNQKKVVEYEVGANHSLYSFELLDSIWMAQHYPVFTNHYWKGAGINIQLSALRSENSWGIGDLGDFKMFNHWAASTGFKLIQLLPLNDTTVHLDERDSYPYAAISAFALHPIFLDINALLHRYKIGISDEWKAASQKLNIASKVEYMSVLSLKHGVVNTLLERIKFQILNDETYQSFFRKNRHWLVPYAAFSVCRDRFGSADYHTWPSPYRDASPTEIKKITSPKSPDFHQIFFYYFLQYELHLQLMDAVSHAHHLGLVIKGDLPIGVGRYSVETWMNPDYFNLDQQAGAPPDAFSKKGQNWQFPTYNWGAMKADGYDWWKKRLTHLEQYMDAIRIDHVLGFFRIWSIPLHAVDGRLGRFVPAIPLDADEIIRYGIKSNIKRLTTPYITIDIWHDLFGVHADFLAEQLLENGCFKKHFQTQKEIQNWLIEYPDRKECEQGLLELLTEVILLEDENRSGQYHFRIDMMDTESYKSLESMDREMLKNAYIDYFFQRQNKYWLNAGREKLEAICRSTRMLICAEDLGMVPEMVGPLLHELEILTLQVQRMPARINQHFANPSKAPYLSVVMPSTHDMSPLRAWWQEAHVNRELFWHEQLGMTGSISQSMNETLSQAIIASHLQSPAMWAIFLLQDLFAFQSDLTNSDPNGERINDPANPNHVWDYRMHISIENLQQHVAFKNKLQSLLQQTQRTFSCH